MALFPVNQNCQFFTPTAAEITELKKAANTSTLLKSGAGKVFFTATSGKYQHTTDPITVKNGGFIKYVAEADMEYKPKTITITYDSTVATTPINGEVYGIYINQRNYHALGDNEFMELGAEVRYGSKFNFDANATLEVTAGEKVINDVKLLMVALAQAFERNLGNDKDLYTIGCTATTVTITEKEQSWLQGLEQNEHVALDTQNVFLSNVTINTIERNDWATITLSEGTGIKNSKDIADMEWFYLGEHGDTQRLMGYPYANRATISGEIYNINPKSSAGYDLIYIHHAYVGNGTFVQKSEKDIMIAVPAGDGSAIGLTLAKSLGAVASGAASVASKTVYPC